MIDQLRHDHDRLRAIAAQLRTLLNQDGARIGLCFAAARWAFTRELLRHMAMEKQFLREQQHACADVSTRSPHNADNLERRFRDHLARWSAMEIDANWKDYCRDLREILDVLEQRMRFEERTVFPRAGRPATSIGSPKSRP